MTAGATSAEPTIVAAEAWFHRHGLPYFVDDERAAVRQGLRPARLVPAMAGSALLGVALGVALGWLTGEVSLGIGTALTFAGIGATVYGLTALRAWPIARWAVARTLKSLGLIFPLATRALPLLLLFVTFLFINTEVWQVASRLDGGVMWLTVMTFTVMAAGFLLARLPEELDRVDDEVEAGRLVAACKGTPLESAARELAESGDHVHQDAEVRGFQKANLVLVLLVAQFVQVLLLAASVFVFFIVFGMVAMDPEVIEIWIERPPTEIFGQAVVSAELVQVSVFLAAFSGLYFTVYAVTDEVYRTQFFTSITNELERAVGARTVYHYLKSSA
ncbi:MAG TPA: hypothetical protein VK204_16885 [Nocardioidaceae bacterium]|nr:hypothetical protein [Nocardioidaceae bacterium]